MVLRHFEITSGSSDMGRGFSEEVLTVENGRILTGVIQSG